MSATASKKIETTANVAIILVALVVGAVLVKRHFLTSQSRTEQPQSSTRGPVPGARTSLDEVDWTKSKQTLLLALSKGCRFCTESAPFYRRLASETYGRSDLRLIAVFPRETFSEAKDYLDELGVSLSDIRHAPLDAIGARGTPTLVLVDSGGTVIDSWTGRLTEEKESELLSRFKCDTCE
jgi:hypothetical protein